MENHRRGQVLQDIHEGTCGNHFGGRSLSNRVLMIGYYWSTMKQDPIRYVKKCDSCQRHVSMTHKPCEVIYPTLTPWLFMKWGINIVGKLPPTPGQKVILLALTYYITKWIEAKSFQHVCDKEVISFIHINIICKFGVPSEIICDHGSQFISDKIKHLCDE